MNKAKTKELRKITALTVINPKTAGIDVSDKEMMLAVPVNDDEVETMAFGTFTQDLNELRDILRFYQIESVAMESTGVYWVPLFLLLQESGFEVCLVNAKHVKNVTGRKDDESDAQWIQKLHSCGLLQASFQPELMTRELRNLMRHRTNLVQDSTADLNRIQKTLELMNIKLHTIISDIDGKTGRDIIEAILGGEYNPETLANLADWRIKATREKIKLSLEGNYSEELLFELEQYYDLYKFHREKIIVCERMIEKQLVLIIASRHEGLIPDLPHATRKVNRKHRSSIDFTSLLILLNGIDITKIPGISETVALTIIAEVGTDMSKWKTDKHFCSWLNLVPNTKKSGGKILSSRSRKKRNLAGQAFRMAAFGLANNKGPFGGFYRRVRSRSGKTSAVIATAHKLAITYYHMMSKQEEFNPELLILYQAKSKAQKISRLKAALAKLEAA